MKKSLLLLFLFLPGAGLLAQNDSASLRDQVLDNVISVTFDAADMRSQLNRFEDEAAIKLHFRVADETLNELGGLSKYLFKIYQSITSTNPDANKTLTGFFSSSENGQLSRRLTYASHASPDLAACLMPPQDLHVMDSAANVYFSKSLASAADLDEAPEYIHDFLKQSTYHYGTIYSAHATTCDSSSTKKSQYTDFLINSRLERSRDWRLQTDLLSEALEIIQRTQVPRSTIASSQTTLSDKVKHVGTLNGSLTQCALTDLQVQGQILYQHTGIHQYLITADVNFLIPLDSMQLFVDQISQKLFSDHPGEKFIVLLWLRLAGSSAHPYNCLLMAQNGAHINRGDVNFARYNYGTKYKASTYLIYTSIYKQIKKPLIICYQTLKANGLITTTYLRKPMTVKGFGQIYVHSFKYDAQLVRLNALEQEIESELAVDHFECKSCPYADRAAMMAERRQLLSSAILKPQLLEAKLHFKQAYLCDLTNARWAVWDWSKKAFPKIFYKTISESFSDYLDGKRGYTEGTCDIEPDLVMDALSVSSLLLSPVNLDFIPDAIAVTYCLAKKRYQDAAANSLSVLIPGSLYATKRLLGNPSELVSAINKGARIVNENGLYKAIDAEQDLLAQCYDLAPEDLKKLPSQLKDDFVLTRELLPTNSLQSQMIANVNELPKAKRLEFLKECSENAQFRQRCKTEQEYVWRWAGKIDEVRGIKREEFLSSVKDFSNKNDVEKCWYLFSTNRFDELEKFMVSKNMNGLYPPMDGFLNMLKTAICEELKDMVFDRYQEFEELAGYFASPMDANGQSYSFESRALHPGKKYRFYYKFKVLDPCSSNLIFTFGEAIRWFGQTGGAIQIKSNINLKLLKDNVDIKILDFKKL